MMIGSTFYCAPIVAEQGAKAALFYDDDVFPTLDFEVILADSGLTWNIGEPIYFDGEEGAALFEVNPADLEFVMDLPPNDNNAIQADLEHFKAFVAQHGLASIYESATF